MILVLVEINGDGRLVVQMLVELKVMKDDGKRWRKGVNRFII